MTVVLGARNLSLTIDVLDSDGNTLSTEDLSDQVIQWQLKTPQFNTSQPNGRMSWDGSILLADNHPTLSLDSRDTTGSPSGAELMARGNRVNLSVADSTGTLRAVPTTLFINAIPQPPNPPQDTVTLTIADTLEAENYPKSEGDKSGFTEGTSTNRKDIIDNIASDQGLPGVAAGDTLTVYPLLKPVQKTDIGSWVEFCGKLAATAGYALWVDASNELRLTTIDLSQSAPAFSITIGSDESVFNFVNQAERAPETLTVLGQGYDVISNTFPRVSETFIYTSRGSLLGSSDPYAGVQTVGEYRTVTESFNGDQFIIETEKQVPRILINPDATLNRVALKTAESITETRNYQNGTDALVSVDIDENWARGWINKQVGSQEFTTSLFNLQNFKDTEIKLIYQAATGLIEEIRTNLDADPSYWASGITTPASFTAQKDLEKWEQKSKDVWNYLRIVQKTAQELYQGDIGNLDPEALVTDPNESISIQTNTGEANPPQIDRKPQQTQSELKQFSGSANFQPIAGRNPKQQKQDSIEVQGPFCVSDAQCTFLSELLGQIRQGRSLAAQFTGAIPDWLLTNYFPLPRVDVTLNSITTAYLADQISIAGTQTESAMSAYLLELGTVGASPSVINQRYQLQRILTGGVTISPIITEKINLRGDDITAGITITPSITQPEEVSANLTFPALTHSAIISEAGEVTANLTFPALTHNATVVDFDADASAYIARLTGTYSAAKQVAINDFFVALKNASLYSKLDAVWLFAMEDVADTLLNIKSTSFTGARVGSMTFTANSGLAGNGSSMYFDTNFNPTTASGNYVQNSASLFAYSNTATNHGINSRDVGGFDETVITDMGFATLSLAKGRINQTTSGEISVSNTDGEGLFTVTRTGASATALYRNASSLGTGTQASNGIPNIDLAIGARNRSGTIIYSIREFAMAGVGAGLNGTEVSNLNTAVSDLLTVLKT